MPKQSRFLPRAVLAFAAGMMIAAPAGSSADKVDQGKISVEQAVQQVQKETRGKVLSVQVVTMGTRQVYRIKVLTPDGRMRVVQVPSEP